MQKQYGGKDKFEKALQQQGLTADKYKENLRTAAYHKNYYQIKLKSLILKLKKTARKLHTF